MALSNSVKIKMCTVCKVKPRASLSAIVCSLECSIKRMNANRNKAKKETASKAISKRELNRTKISWQHQQCQPVFNKLRRLQEFKWFKDRGLEPICISCGKELGNDEWACGHFETVAASSRLRYDPINTYLQHNVRCNKNLSGDIHGSKTTHGYIEGLKIRFGCEQSKEIFYYIETIEISHYEEVEDETGALITIAIAKEPLKWVWQDMQAMRKEWNKQIKILERELDDF